MSKLSYVGEYAFYDCGSLTNFIGENVSKIDESGFQGCYSLKQVYLPNCSYVSKSAFGYCKSLSDFTFPKLSYIGWYAFYSCSSISIFHAYSCSHICPNAFYNCSNLSNIIVEASNCYLENSNTFQNTKITSSTGSILVPDNYVETYKSATNWVYFSNIIQGIGSQS